MVSETYVESHELRSARGSPTRSGCVGRLPLSAAQRDILGRLDVALAIDLPFGVADVAPHLRWVQAVGAGTGQLQSAGLAEAGIRLTTAAGANAVAIAEFAVGRLLQTWKHLRELDELQTQHCWEPRYGRELAGATIGLLGLGAINSAVAARIRAFEVRIVATRRSATPGARAPNVDQLYPPEQLHTMLGQCDAVIAAVPETPQTAGLLTRRPSKR